VAFLITHERVRETRGLAYSITAGGIEAYHTDRLGSVRELTNGAGTVSATYRTDEWGIGTQATGGSTQPFGYTGEPRDGTGLTYLWSRYYDPVLGRFTSRDTWPGSSSASQTLNRYAYVDGNPTTRSDPSGHFLDTVVDIGFIIIDLGSLAFGPPKDYETNSAALGVDLIAAGVPFVTGAGLAVRAAKGAESASDLALHGRTLWARAETLEDHFLRHGADFGATSADEYAQLASDFLKRSQVERLPTKIDGNGVIRVFDPGTNTFGAYNADGTTRTLFRPSTPDYWQTQPGNLPWSP